jgi:cysteine desulfurase family protein (TIGR01976 family)
MIEVEAVRAKFPALARKVGDAPAVYFDGPAGSQVPEQVIDAVAGTLRSGLSNTHGRFVASVELDAMLVSARRAAADFLGADDDSSIVFGANMTTLAYQLGRSLSRTWSKGDCIVVTRLDHDANITPWVQAAHDAGAEVIHIDFRPGDTTLDLDQLRAAMKRKPRFVAVGAASNATGTINPVETICAMAKEAGAEVFVDAVHYAPHRRIDVARWGCDFVACSAYKFFGPHVGILWGKPERMRELPAYQVRAAGDDLPDRWNTGTGNHECIAGTMAAIDYIAGLGRADGGPMERRAALDIAYREIEAHENGLLRKLLGGLAELEAIKVWGIDDAARLDERAPTVAITHSDIDAGAIAERLGDQGIFVWDGNYYAVEVTERLGLEPHGMVRIGLLHYNSESEVQRLLDALAAL